MSLIRFDFSYACSPDPRHQELESNKEWAEGAYCPLSSDNSFATRERNKHALVLWETHVGLCLIDREINGYDLTTEQEWGSGTILLEFRQCALAIPNTPLNKSKVSSSKQQMRMGASFPLTLSIKKSLGVWESLLAWLRGFTTGLAIESTETYSVFSAWSSPQGLVKTVQL